jgi:hypothetical protein
MNILCEVTFWFFQSHYTSQGILGESRYSSYSFSTLALVGGKWSASRPGHPLPPGGIPGTRGWVGTRAGLDTEDRRKILCLCRVLNLDHPVVQPVARHCTDWATRLTNILIIYPKKKLIKEFLWDFKFSRRRVWCSELSSGLSLMMEAVRTSETSVDNHFRRQYNPEDSSEHKEFLLHFVLIALH